MVASSVKGIRMSFIPKAKDFSDEIKRRIFLARQQGLEYIDIVAKEIQDSFGTDYKGHRLPNCCNQMRSLMKPSDQVLYRPDNDKWHVATLTIRYFT